MEALDVATQELRRNPASAVARRDYNFALSRIFEIIKKVKIDVTSKPLTVPSDHGDYVLAAKADPRPEWNLWRSRQGWQQRPNQTDDV